MPNISIQPNRAYPNIPEVSEDSTSHTLALQSIKDALLTHERRDNNYLKSFIRFEELVELGIIDASGEFVLDTPSGGSSAAALDDLTDVTIASLVDNNILGYDFTSGQWTSQNAGDLGLSVVGHTHPPSSGSLDDLDDVNLTGASDFDLLFRTGGDWVPTAGDLQWDGNDLYINTGDINFYAQGGQVTNAIRQNFPTPSDFQIESNFGDIVLSAQSDVRLANNADFILELISGVRWVDLGGVDRELLALQSAGAPSALLERNYNEDLVTSAAAGSTSYVDLADAVITGANFNVGDKYLVMYSGVGTNSSGSPNNNGIRLTLNDVEITGTERLFQSGEATTNDAGNMGAFVTSFVYAAGDLQCEYKDGSAGSLFINGFRMSTVNLTTLGAANYTEDFNNSATEIDNLGGFAATPGTITIGDGVSDYMVLIGVRVNNISNDQTKCRVVLDINAGATIEQLGDEVADGAWLTYSAMTVISAPAANTVLFIKGQVTAFGGTADIANTYLIAIKLNAFDQYVTASDLSPATPGSGDNDYLETNFVSSVDTSNWGFWGYTQGQMGSSNGPTTRIQADINSGGYNNVNFSSIHYQRRQGAADQGCFRFPTFDTQIANADDVDFKMFYNAPTGNDLMEQVHIVAHSWNVQGAEVETFYVGDPLFATVIDGLDTTIDSALEVNGITVINDQLGVTGTIDGLSTLDILGAVQFDTTLNVDGLLTVDDDIVVTGLVDGRDVLADGIAQDAHIADATIHFTEASIDHVAIMNIGTNTHAQIDTHIADATIHFTEASIDHTAILNIGTNTHAQIDTHLADASIHFLASTVGDVFKVGTPVDDEIGVWTGDGTLEGDNSFTWDGAQLDIGLSGSATTPPLLIANIGMYAVNSSTGGFSIGGTARYRWDDDDFGGVANFSARITSAAGSAAVPVFVFSGDEDTGISRPTTDAVGIVTGAVLAQKWVEVGGDVITTVKENHNLTADVGSSQGDGVITSSYNHYLNVANDGDAATLPDVAFTVGALIFIRNDGDNSMDVFPALNDYIDLVQNTAVAVPSKTSIVFMATTNNTHWVILLQTNAEFTTADEINDLTASVTWDDIPDANVPESAVTQHEAALTILESQITDGTILARVAGDEIITGIWNFEPLLNQATGDEIALDIDYTVNKATSGADTGLRLNVTETLSPGTSLFLEMVAGGTTKFSWSTNPTFTMYDDTGADSVSWSLDGSDLNMVFFQTADWVITGMTSSDEIRIEGPDIATVGGRLRLGNISNGDELTLDMDGAGGSSIDSDGTQLTISASGAGGGQIFIPSIIRHAYFNAPTTNYVDEEHDGTDYNTDFAATTDWNITGITSIQAGTIDADFDSLTATDFNAVPLTAAGSAANYLDESGGYSVPAGSGGITDGTVTSASLRWNGSAWAEETEILIRGDGRIQILGVAAGGADGSPLLVRSSNPQFSMQNTGSATDAQVWNWVPTGNTLSLRLLDDTYGGAVNFLQFTRSTTTPTLLTVNADLDVISGSVLRVFEADDSTQFSIAHDANSTEFLLSGTGLAHTANWSGYNQMDISGGMDLRIRDGDLFISNAAVSTYGLFAHNGTDLNLTTVSTADFNMLETGTRLHLPSESDVGLATTNHPFQIGLDNGLNIGFDNNEIFARNNGAAATLNLQVEGGVVAIGVSTTANLTVSGAITAASYDGVNLTTAGAATNFLNEAGGYTVPAVGSHVHDASDITTGIFAVGRLSASQEGATVKENIMQFNRWASNQEMAGTTDWDEGIYGGFNTMTNGPTGMTYDPFLVMGSASDVRSFLVVPRTASRAIAYKGSSSTGASHTAWHYSGWTVTEANAALSLYPRKAEAATITASWKHEAQPQMDFGIGGSYSDDATNDFGATIWSIDETWQGETSGTDSLATNVYGIRWLRSTHTEAHIDIGEGLYVYSVGTLRGGIGLSGIYTPNAVSAADFHADTYGAAGTPTFSTDADGNDTGMYGESSNVLAFSSAGVRRLQLYGSVANFAVPLRITGAPFGKTAGFADLGHEIFNMDGKEAIDASDLFLRLNQNDDFTSGVYTPGAFRVDGVATFNGTIVGDGATTITGIETLTIDSTGDITKASHGNYLYHQSTIYNDDQEGGITFSTGDPTGGADGDIWFKYAA